MSNNTKYILIAISVGLIGYFLWKKHSKSKKA